MHAYMHACMHTHTYIHTYMHACMHACIQYTYIHTYIHYKQQKLNFNRDGLKPYFSTDFDAFYFSHFVTRWRYSRSSIYCQIRRVARLAFVCL